MTADDRRSAILDVAVPLFIKKGASTTTAEVARAAGVAEGTLFRVFPDKSALLLDAVRVTMDPTRVASAIHAIDAMISVERRLAIAAAALRDYFNDMASIGELLRSLASLRGPRQRDMSRLVRDSSRVISAALAELFERDRSMLRVTPQAAAAAFRGLVFASAHPLLAPQERLAIDDAITILMSGISRSREV